MKKRIIASILTVIMLMTMLQTAALAADGEGTEAVASTTPQAACGYPLHGHRKR